MDRDIEDGAAIRIGTLAAIYGVMAKHSTDKLIAQLKKSMGAPPSSGPTRGKFLGFENKRLEQVFRAVAHAHPKAVLVKDDEWKAPADEHVKMGYMKCAVHSQGPDLIIAFIF